MSSHLAGRFLACCSRLLVGPPCVCLGAFGFYLNVTKQAGFRSEKLGKRQATKIEVLTMRVVTTANNSVSVVSTEEFAVSLFSDMTSASKPLFYNKGLLSFTRISLRHFFLFLFFLLVDILCLDTARASFLFYSIFAKSGTYGSRAFLSSGTTFPGVILNDIENYELSLIHGDCLKYQSKKQESLSSPMERNKK